MTFKLISFTPFYSYHILFMSYSCHFHVIFMYILHFLSLSCFMFMYILHFMFYACIYQRNGYGKLYVPEGTVPEDTITERDSDSL